MNIIGGIWDMMEERRRRRNRETAVVFGVGCGAFLICGIVVIIVGSILNAIETGAVHSAYGSTYASACQPMPFGSDSLDNLNDGSSPRKVLLLTGGTQRRDAFHSELPKQWRAENEESVSLIACVEHEKTVIETCEYERSSNNGTYTARIKREQHTTTIALVNPNSGRRIDSLEIIGAEPNKCPDDYDDAPTSRIISGGDVEWDKFASWIEGYVFRD